MPIKENKRRIFCMIASLIFAYYTYKNFLIKDNIDLGIIALLGFLATLYLSFPSKDNKGYNHEP